MRSLHGELANPFVAEPELPLEKTETVLVLLPVAEEVESAVDTPLDDLSEENGFVYSNSTVALFQFYLYQNPINFTLRTT